MDKQYVEHNEEGYKISGSRVSLESVIFPFQDGLSPETIATECFPTLSLEQVYGAITYYLSHRNEVDSYLREVQTAFETFQQNTRDPEFSHKIAQMRRQLQVTST